MGATMSPVSVAALNTVFRTVTVLILAPAIGLLGKLACLIMKDEPSDFAQKEHQDWDLLDERFLAHPTIAIEQSRTFSLPWPPTYGKT